ncbi:hypothetical protein LguiA_017968 [Lonicera macranthoides]
MMSNSKDQFHMADLHSALLPSALSAEDRVDLVNSIKSKLHDLAGDHADFLDTLSQNVRNRVDVLREIQSQHDELEAKYIEERAALEAKFQKLYGPLYTKRFEIVNGVVEVDGVLENHKNDQSMTDKGVPNFWLTAMKTNEVLAEEISESDEGALQYLKDIKWSRIDGSKGFKLEFFFDSNPYFKNTVLTKTYHMINEDEHILENSIGTEIEWYPGKILTEKILKKKVKKGSKNFKPIMRSEDCESFFNFFSPPQVPVSDDDIDEDMAEVLQSQMEQDYDIASTIREKIIPHAVSWFTGEAAQIDDEDDIEKDDDDDDTEKDVDEDEHGGEDDDSDGEEVDDDDDDDDDDDVDEDEVKQNNNEKKVEVCKPIKVF